MRPPISRRTFLGASTAGLAAGSASVIPRPARARPIGANERITLGFIGTGGMGRGLINRFKQFDDVAIAAVCDVYEQHARQAASAAASDPVVFKDFRRLIDRDDLDAIVVATPDHWHAIPTILACQAGKDVYCEKPLAWCVEEGSRIVRAARKHDRVTQMGNLIHATENYHRVAEVLQSGCLGRVTKARVWMARNDQDFLGRPADTEPPSGCDYDFWLGPAPKRPFNPNRFTFNWRYFWDYAGGLLADFVCHLVDPIHWGLRATAPQRIAGTGGRFALDDHGETPDTFDVTYLYAGGWQLVWSLQSRAPHGFHGRSAGLEVAGTKGTLHAHYNDYVILPNPGETIEEPEPFLPRSVGHHREWLDAIKTRARCSCDFGYGHELTNVGHLGNIAIRTGKTLEWDADAERVTNDEAANDYLNRSEYRAPWRLPEV